MQHDLHLMVFTDSFFEINGVRTFYRTLLDWARRTQYAHVTVFCPEPAALDPGMLQDGVVPLRPLARFREPIYHSLTLGHYPQSMIARAVSTLPGEPIFHIATSGPLGYAGSVFAKRRRLPCVGFYNTDLPRYGEANGGKYFGGLGRRFGYHSMFWFDKLGYRHCRGMCAPSESAARTAKAFFKGPIRVTPYPLAVGHFQPAATREGAFRRRYGEEGKALVSVIGRLGPEKNLDLVCQHLSPNKNLRLVFVGDGPYAPTLRQRWDATVTGFLHGSELVEAYQQSDVFVQLSVTETFGLALAEALACGLPAKVLRSPGLASTLPAGAGLEVLEFADLPELAERCVALVRDRTRHEAAAKNARELILPFAPDVVLPKMFDFHREIARRYSSGNGASLEPSAPLHARR